VPARKSTNAVESVTPGGDARRPGGGGEAGELALGADPPDGGAGARAVSQKTGTGSLPGEPSCGAEPRPELGTAPWRRPSLVWMVVLTSDPARASKTSG
jgi:hypothetical protein